MTDAQETGRELEKENDRQDTLGDGMYNFQSPWTFKTGLFLAAKLGGMNYTLFKHPCHIP